MGMIDEQFKSYELKKIMAEIEKYKLGYDRYEKLRRLNPAQFRELYEKNLTSGTHFDILVDQL